MAVTLASLALHVLGKQEDALSTRERADLESLRSVSSATVYSYIGATCPSAVKDAARLRYAYYDYHVRLSRKPADGGVLEQHARRDLSTSPFRASGAMAILAPWKVRRGGTTKDPDS